MPPMLYLIDGHALAYRTYFALTASAGSRFSTSSGEPTAGVYGFTSVLLKILDTDRPDYIAVAFDGGHSFRDKVYPDYKATREKMPDDLVTQMARIRALVDAFGIPRLEMENYEADDILGTIARQAVAKGLGVKIITGDRDLLQLVDDRIVVNLAGSRLADAKDYNAAEVKEYLGVRPDQVVDYKALVGDKSDNIPGVAGVGEKIAIQLLTTYPSLDEIYAHLPEIPGKLQNRLEAGKESALMSYDLARIRTDLKILLDLEAAKTGKINLPAVVNLFQELEFRSILQRVYRAAGVTDPGHEPAEATAPPPAPSRETNGQLNFFGAPVTTLGDAPSYELTTVVIDTPAALSDLTAKLSQAALISLDTETTSTDPLRSELVGISLAVAEGTGYYLPVGHRGGEPQLPLETVRAALTPILSNPAIPLIGQNLKFDKLALRSAGIPCANIAFDTMLAEWVLDPSSRSLGLKDITERYLGARMTHIEELIGKGKAQLSMADVPVAQVAPYAAADAEVCLRLKPILDQRLDESGYARQLFEEIEMPLVPVLADMEWEGISLDSAYLAEMGTRLAQRLAEIETQIYQLVGHPFNINSTQQLSRVLFDTLHLEPPDRRKKTASGHYSTSAEVLEQLRGSHPVVDLILENRELAKLKSTYIDALPLQVNPRDQRVHTSFNQAGAVTGRLASADPNLQNIPTRTELGRQVRNAFVAAPGWLLLSVDYSQIELRIVAHAAHDEVMLDAFRHGEDIHAATASVVFHVPLSEVTKTQRSRAKAVNFGMIYGISPYGLSRSISSTVGEAETIINEYFVRFASVKQYLDSLRTLAATQGYVETLHGRRRYFPNLAGTTGQFDRRREEREATNAPIQGTAADIMKLAMVRVANALRETKSPARLLLQVHDELVLEVPEEALRGTAQLVRREMENVYPLSVPLETEARCGRNWGEMEVLRA